MLNFFKNHYPYLVAICSYLLFVVVLAGIRPFWADELYTLYIAETDSFGQILKLLGPMDPHPPIQYFLTLISHRLFGISELTTRLPSVMMYGVFITCVYFLSLAFIGRKAAFFSFVITFLSVGIAYSYEARPYASVLGFLSLTYCCWVFYKRTKSFYLIPVLCVLCGLVVVSHFYAILALLPLFIIELWELIKGRKAQALYVLASMSIGCCVLVFLIPTLKSIQVLSEKNWAAPSSHQFFVASFHMYWHLIILLIVASFDFKKVRKRIRDHLTLNQQIWVFGLLATLVVYGFLISFISGAYHYRYVFGAFLGSVILGGLIFQFLNRKQTFLACLLIIGVGLFKYGVPFVLEPLENREEIEKEVATIENRIKVPVAYTHPMDMLPIYHYSSDLGRSSMYYPIDYTVGYDFYHFSADISIRNLARIKKDLNLPDLNDFSNKNGEFVLRGNRSFSYQLKDYLIAHEAGEVYIDGLKFHKISNKQ